MQDYPVLQRTSYKDTLLGKKQKFVFRPDRRKSFSAQKQSEKFSKHYTDLASIGDPATALGSNHNRVSDVEKERTLLDKARLEGNFAIKDSTEVHTLPQSPSSEMVMEIQESQQPEEKLQMTENNNSLTH